MKANALGNAGDMLTTRDFDGKELAGESSEMEGRRETDHRSVRTGPQAPLNWASINWAQVKRDVEEIQREIFRDTRAGVLWRVIERQKLLVRSLSARCWAVRLVCEINKGRHTSGIDGVTCEKAEQKAALVERLRLGGYKPDPVRTIWIPKSNGDMRKLGIPMIRDRAMQVLILLAMNPEWEARFEPNSFGFRPGRNAIDAVAAVTNLLTHRKGRKPHPGWILDADISKCFDTIDHEALLGKLSKCPFRQHIRAWLKSGAIGAVGFERTEKGTPQGGVISPLLANIALDGLERLFGITTSTGNYNPPNRRRGLNKGVVLYRYADDFIVLAPSKMVLESHVVPKIKAFLAVMGLSLSEAKTRIVNVSEGFEFLGFGFRRYYQKTGEIRQFRHYPSRGRLDKFLNRLAEYVRFNWNVDVKELVIGINRRVIGACNYYKWSSAHKEFAYLAYRLWGIMWQWAKHRHPHCGRKWLVSHYWKRNGRPGREFSFQGVDLINPCKLTAKWWMRPQLKTFSSPFDPAEIEYWSKRVLKWKYYRSENP